MYAWYAFGVILRLENVGDVSAVLFYVRKDDDDYEKGMPTMRYVDYYEQSGVYRMPKCWKLV